MKQLHLLGAIRAARVDRRNGRYWREERQRARRVDWRRMWQNYEQIVAPARPSRGAHRFEDVVARLVSHEQRITDGLYGFSPVATSSALPADPPNPEAQMIPRWRTQAEAYRTMFTGRGRGLTLNMITRTADIITQYSNPRVRVERGLNGEFIVTEID